MVFDILEPFFQLLLATILGGLVGIERELAGKTAGLRTYALVALGSALFSLMSKMAFVEYIGLTNLDPARIAAQIVVGVGFIGAGVIIFNRSHVKGITTATGLWVAAAIGMAVAYRFYALAVFTTFLTLVILGVLWWFEIYLDKNFHIKKTKDE
ncbi:MAG: MgtC/SapB family protein [Patescibacteria group bacterium]